MRKYLYGGCLLAVLGLVSGEVDAAATSVPGMGHYCSGTWADWRLGFHIAIEWR